MVQDTSSERWLPVVGFEGKYEVSDLGRVRSLDRMVSTSNGTGLRPCQGRVLSTQKRDGNGYVQHTLSDGTRKRPATAHVLVLEAFIGPRPDGNIIRHLDGNSLNNTLSNLRWGTQAANVADTIRHGRHRELAKVACIHGHRLVAPNLIPAKLPHRRCLACARARTAIQHRPDWEFTTVAARKYAEIMG